MRRHLFAVAVAAALSACTVPAKAGPLCYVEGSAGKNLTATRVSDQIDGAVTVTADGAQIGIGAGCDWEQGGFVAGLLARYDYTDVSGSVGSVNIGADHLWTVAARGGFRVNPSTLVYGLAGIAGTNFSAGDIKYGPTGIVYGLGIETNIGIQNLVVGFEWDHVAFDNRNDGLTSIRPDADIFRITAKVKVDLFR